MGTTEILCWQESFIPGSVLIQEELSMTSCRTTARLGNVQHIVKGIKAFYLYMQDFAFESNEQRMRAAAHLMAASLAGAYAMNQCREPMRASLLSQLHALLKPGLDPPVSITAHDLTHNNSRSSYSLTASSST